MPHLNLATFLGSAAPSIDIIDVGAMILAGATNEYQPLVQQGVGHVVGFEPIPEECEKLNRTCGKNQRFLPYFIGDGNSAEFKQCTAPFTSSLLEPNLPLLRRFNQLEEITTPIKRSSVNTRRLDDIPEITGMDLLKIDVQGAELDVLRGGERLLKNAVVVQTEVEFLPMYISQPLFADIDAELRRQGFCIHIMGEGQGRCFKPLAPAGDPGRRINQVMWADAVYIKDFMRFRDLSPEQLLKLAVIVNDCYHSHDLAAYALQHYDARTGKGLWPLFMRRLLGQAPPPPPPLDDAP
ncbi:MAG TPA: FkbM family methyltransferase [Phycisphaerales bacterium]|nr:FkbM family methyltransferase [Phycisphaerales bacterium]